MKTVGTLLFPGFELLDVFGPLEMFGALDDEYRLERTDSGFVNLRLK